MSATDSTCCLKQQVAEMFNLPTPAGLQPPHSLRRSPRFLSPTGVFAKHDGQKFLFDDLDFPGELDSSALEFVSLGVSARCDLRDRSD